MKKCGVYIITAPSGHQYVGSAVSIPSRWSSHRGLLRKGKHHSRALQHAFNKYGETALIFKILLICSKANLTLYEQLAMDALKPIYNVLKYARSPLGSKHSAETREKIRVKALGRKCSPETVEKIRASLLGRKHTPEQNANHSAALCGRKHSKEHVEHQRLTLVGKPKTKEAIEKLRVALTGRKLTSTHTAAIGFANTGKKRSEETKRKMSEAAKAWCSANKELVKQRNKLIHCGAKRSPEARAKMSQARRIHL